MSHQCTRASTLQDANEPPEGVELSPRRDPDEVRVTRRSARFDLVTPSAVVALFSNRLPRRDSHLCMTMLRSTEASEFTPAAAPTTSRLLYCPMRCKRAKCQLLLYVEASTNLGRIVVRSVDAENRLAARTKHLLNTQLASTGQ